MTCQACGKPHPSVAVDHHGAPSLCTWCYLKRPFPGVSIGGTINANDTLSSPKIRRPELPLVEPALQEQKQAQELPSSRKEETPTPVVSASAGGATEEKPRKRADSQYFKALETDAVNLGATPVRLDLPDDLTPIQRAVAEDVAHVAGVYAMHHGPGGDIPYSCRWRADVLELSHTSIAVALGELVKRGVLEGRGEMPPLRGYPRGTKLYAVGQREPMAVQVEHAAVEPVAVEDEQRAVRLAQVAPAVAGHARTVAPRDGAEDRQLGVTVHDRDATADLGAQCAIFDWDG